jgi:transposase InsO family protein
MRLCRFFDFSRQAYYQAARQEQTSIEQNAMLLEEVLRIRRKHSKMGGRKLYFKLESAITQLTGGMGRDKFFDFLRAQELLVIRKRKYAVTTQSFQRFHKYKDHYNGIVWTRPNQVWVSDITYLRVVNDFHYLFLVTDAYSRKIVGWQLGNTLETKWAVAALRMAMSQCSDLTSLVHHSDRGFQYCSREYAKLLEGNGATLSMGQVGNCYDNALAERVNGILKDEYLLDNEFTTPSDALNATSQAVKLYNEDRPHLSLNMQTPASVHKAA